MSKISVGLIIFQKYCKMFQKQVQNGEVLSWCVIFPLRAKIGLPGYNAFLSVETAVSGDNAILLKLHC